MAVKTFGVIGAGQMGNGIAQVAASPGGLNVIMNDIADQFVDRGFDTISKNLDRLVAKEKLTADQKKEILGRIKKSTNLEDMKDADFVVEAAVEREDLKLNIFKKLDEVCKPDVILATNTSSIPITRSGVVGTLWSGTAMVWSGRRTLRPLIRKPSKACGLVTSWTRWRSM